MVRRASLQRKVGPSTPKRGQPLASATYDCLFFGCLEDGVHLGNMNLDREGFQSTSSLSGLISSHGASRVPEQTPAHSLWCSGTNHVQFLAARTIVPSI